MSRFLHIECDPVHQPAATDALERATWSSLRIRIGARTVSRVLDRKLNDERSLLYVPLFAVAEWMVKNWWALLHEPCRSEAVPPADAEEPEFSWNRRHCMRSAESDLLLPALYVYSDGRGVRAEWKADGEDALPHMPAFFVDAGWSELEREPVEQSLARFICDVLDRIEGIEDPRAEDVRRAWRAIREADAEERAFCMMAGRLGLDPYDPEEVPESLARTLEMLNEDTDPLVHDLTSVATAASLRAQWEWVDHAKRSRGLTGRAPIVAMPTASGLVRADRFGYLVAQEARKRALCAPNEPLESVADAGSRALGVAMRVVHENHLVERNVKLIVGNADGGVEVVGPALGIEENERFRVARALFHALVSAGRGPRLVTDAFTWEQRASRAFAAELLAPQDALKSRAGRWADRSMIHEFAREFGASSILIEKQLKNAHVQIWDD